MKRIVQTLLVLATAAASRLARARCRREEGRAVRAEPRRPSRRTAPTTPPPSSLDGPRRRQEGRSVFAIGLEALKWVGASSRQVGVPYPDLWCADFINFILRRTGHVTTNSRSARSFLDYGKRIDSPRVGAIVVLTRGGPNNGHVGIVRGTDGAGNIIVISGNHGNKVWESPYPKSRVLGYVIPKELN